MSDKTNPSATKETSTSEESDGDDLFLMKIVAERCECQAGDKSTKGGEDDPLEQKLDQGLRKTWKSSSSFYNNSSEDPLEQKLDRSGRKTTKKKSTISPSYFTDSDDEEETTSISNLNNNKNECVEEEQIIILEPPQLRSQPSVPGAHAIGGGRPTSRRVIIPSEGGLDDPIIMRPTTINNNAIVEGAVILEAEVEDLEEGVPNEEQEVIEGQILRDGRQHNTTGYISRTKACMLVGSLVMILLTGVILLVLVLIPSSSSKENANKYQAEPFDETTKVVVMVHPPYADGLSHEIITGIQDVTSAYYAANAWMVLDPFLDTYSPDRQKQRFLIAYLFFKSNGGEWFRNDHWMSYNVSECEWFSYPSSLEIGGWNMGMEPEPICDEDNNLLVLNLTSNNLNGTSVVQSEGISPFLRIFDVSNNQIRGSMPAAGTHAANLEVLITSNNLLEGPILGGGGFAAFKLRILKIGGNQLVGSYPIVCVIMPDLEVIDVAGNLLDKDVDRGFEGCRNLTHLRLGNNYYVGQIPTTLGLLPLLRELDFSGNPGITGTVPTELDLLPDLSLLDITGTSINGSIPEPLCARAETDELSLVANCSHVRCCYK